MLWVDQVVQPSNFMHWLPPWLWKCTLSAPKQIQNTQTNNKILRSIFIFSLRTKKLEDIKYFKILMPETIVYSNFKFVSSACVKSAEL